MALSRSERDVLRKDDSWAEYIIRKDRAVRSSVDYILKNTGVQ